MYGTSIPQNSFFAKFHYVDKIRKKVWGHGISEWTMGRGRVNERGREREREREITKSQGGERERGAQRTTLTERERERERARDRERERERERGRERERKGERKRGRGREKERKSKSRSESGELEMVKVTACVFVSVWNSYKKMTEAVWGRKRRWKKKTSESRRWRRLHLNFGAMLNGLYEGVFRVCVLKRVTDFMTRLLQHGMKK